MSSIKINQSFKFANKTDATFLQSVCRHIGRSTRSPFDNESLDKKSYTGVQGIFIISKWKKYFPSFYVKDKVQ